MDKKLRKNLYNTLLIVKYVPKHKILYTLIIIMKAIPLFIITHDWNIYSKKGTKTYTKIEKIVSEVETEIRDYIMEVPSTVIGQKILQKL